MECNTNGVQVTADRSEWESGVGAESFAVKSTDTVVLELNRSERKRFEYWTRQGGGQAAVAGAGAAIEALRRAWLRAR